MSNDMWENVAYLKSLATTLEDRNFRKEICENCPLLNQLKVCKSCRCFMPLKTWLKDQSCPEGKW